MSLIVDGIEIPNNDEFIKIGGTTVDKVIYNGVSVWERQLGIPVTYPANGGWTLDYSFSISDEGKLQFYTYVMGPYGNFDSAAISPIFSTSLYSKFTCSWSLGFNHADVHVEIRYSNDKTSWTEWNSGYATGSSSGAVDIGTVYEYAQVRIRLAGRHPGNNNNSAGFAGTCEELTFYGR